MSSREAAPRSSTLRLPAAFFEPLQHVSGLHRARAYAPTNAGFEGRVGEPHTVRRFAVCPDRRRASIARRDATNTYGPCTPTSDAEGVAPQMKGDAGATAEEIVQQNSREPRVRRRLQARNYTPGVVRSLEPALLSALLEETAGFRRGTCVAHGLSSAKISAYSYFGAARFVFGNNVGRGSG